MSASLIPPADGTIDEPPQLLVLPIVGGDTDTELVHAGGVTLRALGLTVDVTNVVIHFAGPDAQKVTADLSVAGLVRNVAVADVIGPNQLAIDPDFASGLRSFGAPDLTGTVLATIITQPQLASTASPEPVATGLIAVGLIGVAALRYKAARGRLQGQVTRRV